jgi:ABC-type Na+ efflux pump permease subunit
VFGLSLLGTLFVLDYFYFYRMLLAVVRHAEDLEIASHHADAPITFGLTSCISNSISRKRASAVLLLFYAIPLVSGLLFLLCLVTLDIPNGSQ